ncbi:MAG: Asp-tRNA(Asn)/Glu-tRNA(Gln) amidotransferase subunit GatC [Clostridia bacterium]|nr:Asp-tRNA(Asn)/Glu-tRNA(Gln) amidotransferase subunit GatC [Clostridia bacterium]
MDKDTLRRLEMLNQLSLTEAQKEDVIAFFEKRDSELSVLEAIDTENTERMVHVMPIMTVVREDVVKKQFAREELQKGAPDTDEGYWCVPRVVE